MKNIRNNAIYELAKIRVSTWNERKLARAHRRAQKQTCNIWPDWYLAVCCIALKRGLFLWRVVLRGEKIIA
jgi:hypothetical protein